MTPRREHVAVAMALGLVASLCVHLPVYGVLGALADKLLAEGPRADRSVAGEADPMEWVDLTEDVDDLIVPMTIEPAPEAPPEQAEEGEVDPRAEVERPTPQREEEPPPEEEAPVEEPEVQPPAPQTPPPDNLTAVTQRSRDPRVEAPANPRFVAEENNQVEEEAVARMRNMVRDDPEPDPGEPQEDSAVEDDGNANEEVVRETRENESVDDRAGREDDPQEATVARESGRVGGEGDRSGDPREDAERGRQASEGGQEPEMETIVVSDGVGTFTIRRPRAVAEGSGGGATGGESRSGREARSARGGGAGGAGPNLQIGWSQFQAIVGDEQLEREREEYAQARLSKQRGRSADRRRRWREFRSAIENYVAQVRPGNQTALNAAASPFAGFIAEVHRRVHMEYHQFLAGLPMDGPMSDMTLKTKLEIIFRSDGTVDRIGVVNTSGVLTFDLGAFTAVMDAQPYPPPPRSILSPDDRVYMHWVFMRDQPFCHQSHAAPFILSEAPARPDPGSGGPGTRLPTRPAQGGLVPSDAQRNYGLGRQPREGEPTPEADSVLAPEPEADPEADLDESDSEDDATGTDR